MSYELGFDDEFITRALDTTPCHDEHLELPIGLLVLTQADKEQKYDARCDGTGFIIKGLHYRFLFSMQIAPSQTHTRSSSSIDTSLIIAAKYWPGAMFGGTDVASSLKSFGAFRAC